MSLKANKLNPNNYEFGLNKSFLDDQTTLIFLLTLLRT